MISNGELYIKILTYIKQCAETTDRLPNEVDMATMFQVSRVKLRDILAVLKNNGYIMRKKGAGTCINKYILAETARLDVDVFFEELISASGFAPFTKVHTIKAMHHLPHEMRTRLEVAEGDTVYKIEKTIFADGNPAIFITDYLPYKYYNKDEIDINLLAQSTFWFVQNYCDELVDNLIVHIEAIGAQGKTAAELNLPEGSPILHLSSVSYNQSLSPIVYSTECYNTKLLPLSFQKRIILSKLQRD